MTRDLTIVDIETEPVEEWALKNSKPFEPDSVKTGNMGPEKAAEKIEKARADHERDLLDEAALHPWSARVCAIGYMRRGDKQNLHYNTDEYAIVNAFWNAFNSHSLGSPFVFWSGSSDSSIFDIDFIVHRSWVLGHPVPVDQVRRGRYYEPSRIIDLSPIYLQHKWGERCSLNMAAKRLGLFESRDDLVDKGTLPGGEEFHRLIKGSDEDKALALKYLSNDLKLTQAIAERIL